MPGQTKAALTEHFATDDQPFHFVDSGLDNVYLVGIKYFTDPDGRTVAEIPAAKQVMRVIARDLVVSKANLTRAEVRFLRKRLGKKATEYCKFLGLEPETLSRIENGQQAISSATEKLARLSYALLSEEPGLYDHAKTIFQSCLANSGQQKKRSSSSSATTMNGVKRPDLPQPLHAQPRRPMRDHLNRLLRQPRFPAHPLPILFHEAAPNGYRPIVPHKRMPTCERRHAREYPIGNRLPVQVVDEPPTLRRGFHPSQKPHDLFLGQVMGQQGTDNDVRIFRWIGDPVARDPLDPAARGGGSERGLDRICAQVDTGQGHFELACLRPALDLPQHVTIAATHIHDPDGP